MVNYNEMINVKISSRLEATMAMMVFRLKRDGVTTCYVDRLVAELIADNTTFASIVTNLALGAKGKDAVYKRITEIADSSSVPERNEPEQLFKQLCQRLYAQSEAKSLSSVHVLCWALRNASSATAQAFRERGVIAEEVVDVVYQLVSGEYGNKTHIE
jgi:hypothetical protein